MAMVGVSSIIGTKVSMLTQLVNMGVASRVTTTEVEALEMITEVIMEMIVEVAMLTVEATKEVVVEDITQDRLQVRGVGLLAEQPLEIQEVALTAERAATLVLVTEIMMIYILTMTMMKIITTHIWKILMSESNIKILATTTAAATRESHPPRRIPTLMSSEEEAAKFHLKPQENLWYHTTATSCL